MGETEDYTEDIVLLPHANTHQDGGTDEINLADLSGELTDDQKSAWAKISGKPSTFAPALHALTHKLGGTDVIDIAGLIFKSLCHAHLSTAQDMPTGVVTLVNLDATRVDRNSDFNTTTHKFICPVNGVYLALAQVTYKFQSAGKLHYAYVYKNAGQYGRSITHSAIDYRTAASTFCLINCVAGDELTLRGEHNKGSDLGLHTGDTDTILVVLLLYET